MITYCKDTLRSIFQYQLVQLEKNGIVCVNREEIGEKIPENVDASSHRHIPILIVLPLDYLPFDTQIRRVWFYKGVTGYSFLDPKEIRNVSGVSLPSKPYIITDVEDGTETLGVSAGQCFQKPLFQKDRHLFVPEHGLALLRHYPETLERHGIVMSGSALEGGYVPDFYMYSGRVKMKRERPDDGDPRWGSPSYSEIITVQK